MRRSLRIAGPFMVFVLAWIMNGCEYEVAQPHWDDPFEKPPDPVITAIDPPEVAPPGANTITLFGEHFGDGMDRNWVYFDKVPAELLSANSQQIIVRRPNLVTEGCIVKVVPRDALTFATYGPYAVDPVWSRVGNFPENLRLNDVTVDAEGNLYVFQNNPRSVYQIAKDGTMRTLLESSRAVIDAKWVRSGVKGKIILLMNNRSINQLDLNTDPPTESEWIRIAKRVSYGDFDRHGTFYSAGSRTDLEIVTKDLREKPLLGVYASDDITSVRVFGDYLYLVVKLGRPAPGDPVVGIWRHAILDGEGSLGPRELVLDWSTTGPYAASTIQDMTFAADGTMIVATNHTNPFLMVKPDGSRDVLYKSILPTYPVQIEWGVGDSFYMILGDNEWTVVRIDMGTAGAPYYGRLL